jgi:hypothetical protein
MEWKNNSWGKHPSFTRRCGRAEVKERKNEAGKWQLGNRPFIKIKIKQGILRGWA